MQSVFDNLKRFLVNNAGIWTKNLWRWGNVLYPYVR